MAIKKGDLVEIKTRPLKYGGQALDFDFALVLKGPYEESITLTDRPFPVTVIELVCDIISGEIIYKAIPLEYLVRYSFPQKQPDASL